MAINFPNSPSTNDTHTVGDKTWTWNGTYWHLNQNSSTYYAQDGVPSNPDGGDFWFESDTGHLFVRYDSAWVEIGHATDLSGSFMSDADGDTLIQLEEGSDEDIIRFDTGGTERMTIAANGAVGIVGTLTVGDVVINGTTTTINSTTLTVDDKNIELGSVASPSDTTADGGGITLKGASDKTILWTNSTDAWHFNQGINVTSGNVGIGATNPAHPLDVVGASHTYIGILAGTNSSAGLRLRNDARDWDVNIRADDKFSVFDQTASAARLTIDTSGNVGIGTTSPTHALHVDGTVKIEGASSSLISNNTGSGREVLQVRSKSATTDGAGFNMYGDGDSSHASKTFFYNDSSTPTMTMLPGGNVGIGTTSPAAPLQVNTTASDAATLILNTTHATSKRCRLQFAYGGTQGWEWGTDLSVNGGTELYAYNRAQNVIAMTVLDTGKVGIGYSVPAARLVVAEIHSAHSMPALGSMGGLFGFFNQDAVNGALKYGLIGSVEGSGSTHLQAGRVDGTATAYNLILQQHGGSVGIGATSPDDLLHVWKGTAGSVTAHADAQVVIEAPLTAGLQFLSGSGQENRIIFGDAYDNDIGGITYDHDDNSIHLIRDTKPAIEVRTGASAHGGTHTQYGGVGFTCASVWLDRNWGNYPGFTIPNTTVASGTTQGEFRFHGANHTYASYPATSGSDFAAAVRADNGFITGSDSRRKANITTISGALATVNNLRGVEFNTLIRDGSQEIGSTMGGKVYGFIGQEAKDHIPNAVTYYPDEDEPLESGWCSAYSVNYAPVTAVLVEAIKELTTRLEALEAS